MRGGDGVGEGGRWISRGRRNWAYKLGVVRENQRDIPDRFKSKFVIECSLCFNMNHWIRRTVLAFCSYRCYFSVQANEDNEQDVWRRIFCSPHGATEIVPDLLSLRKKAQELGETRVCQVGTMYNTGFRFSLSKFVRAICP